MEPTTLEKALDLKSKVMVLLKACSEVSNYLSVKIDDIQKDSSRLSEIADAVSKAAKEKEGIEKALVAIKRDYENEKKSLEEFKNSKTKEIAGLYDLAAKDRDEAKVALTFAKANESEANKKFEEADKLKRALDEKLAAIASIG